MAEAAAKEPSMEDILSSIRKIIADEKPGDAALEPGPAEISQEPELRAEPQTVPVEQEQIAKPAPSPTVSETAARVASEEVRSHIAHRMPSAPKDPIPAPSNPQVSSLVDTIKSVAAEDKAPTVYAEPEAETVLATRAPSVAEEPPQNAAVPPRAATLQQTAPQPTASHEAGHGTVTAAQPHVPQSPVRHIKMADAKPAPQREPEAQKIDAAPTQPSSPQPPVSQVAAPSASPASTDEAAAFKGALMSPSANEAVTDAFERLKRSAMDDIDAKTEAILRPMLREWLDENLPALVERLVREEIERVARG